MNHNNTFIISKDYLSTSQIGMIKNHIDVCESFNINVYQTDSWDIIENEKYVKGSALYDSLDMHYFLKDVADVDMDFVHWVSDMTEFEIENDFKMNNKKIVKDRKPKLLKIKRNEN